MRQWPIVGDQNRTPVGNVSVDSIQEGMVRVLDHQNFH